jgi:hypothetical protein
MDERAPDGGPPLEVPPSTLDDRPWTWRGGPYTLLGARLVVRCEHPGLGAFLDTVLAAFAVDDGGRAALLDVVGWNDTWVAYIDGNRAAWAPTPGGLARTLLWYTNALALRAPTTRVHVHAAVASLGDRAVLLPGQSGAGKTTLVAALVLAGFRYLSDEVAAVDPEDLRVHPYPRPLALEPGGRALLPALPRRWPRDADLVEDLEVVPPDWLARDAIGGPAAPAAVVFPTVRKGMPTELRRLARSAALVELLTHVIDADGGGRRSFETLGAMLQLTSCWRLQLDGVASAPELIESALEA